MSHEERLLVIDLGGTRVRAALADHSLRLAHRIEESTEIGGGPDSVIAQMVRMGKHVQVAGGGATRLGVSAPGPLDSKTGVVYSPPNMPGWGTVPLARRLEEALHLPACILNDASA